MERLDSLLVKRGLVTSRERAKEVIQNGQVSVSGKVVTKASFQTEEDSEVQISGELLKYVSRGGLKLEKAVEMYKIDLSGKVCMDIGASTGGFTDVMLQNGATKVYAVDVGTAQLHPRLLEDARVVSMEQTNAKDITTEMLVESPDFIATDVSFISLTKILPVIYRLLKNGCTAVCLIKPQFEAGKQALNKKGVVKDKKVHEKVVSDIKAFATLTGFQVLGTTESPVKGPEGNTEFLIYLRKTGEGSNE